ncbi:MAG TPA: anhydro-N-acetylmuramic acid kinase [Draconibacterium sp.]|nr:anhydro-N-acetylmuramic acid kinase [Draconibacterium sp.]
MKLEFKNKIKAVGLMSGTSLDGLDLIAVEFHLTNGKWTFNIDASETISYSKEWTEKLKNAPSLTREKLIVLDSEYGRFLGHEINRFIKVNNFTPDLIASHGHTVFHQPHKHFTFQVGNGADIAAVTQIAAVADFRTGDVVLGGQGAPLVPVGDRLLFSEYHYCLNLGGFANISFEKNKKRIAFDICPVNMILNYFAEKQGLEFDTDGEMGRKGKVDNQLLQKLNQLDFYHIKPPKSLGREWVETIFMPVMNTSEITEEDKMRTVYEHVAQQIGKTTSGKGEMLITGGGTFNTFLMERISHFTSTKIIIPAKEIINFKEALIFAFLGVLRIKGQNNCLSSVTGAPRDHSSGVIFNPLNTNS